MRDTIKGLKKGIIHGIGFCMILGLFFYIAKGDWDDTNPLKVKTGTQEVLTSAKWNELVDKIERKSWGFSGSHKPTSTTETIMDTYTITLDRPAKVYLTANADPYHPFDSVSYRCSIMYYIYHNFNSTLGLKLFGQFSAITTKEGFGASLSDSGFLNLDAGTHEFVLKGKYDGANKCTFFNFNFNIIEL